MTTNVTREEMFRIRPCDLKQIGAHGSGRIEVEVHGYWSEVASLYINRDWKGGAEFAWNITQTHSSGGRELKVEMSDLVAEHCFAHAILALSALGLSLSGKIPELEVAYQEQKEKDKIARALEEAKKQESIAADVPLGENGAKSLVAYLEARARNQLRRDQEHRVLNRGSDKGYTVGANCSGDRITFRSKGSVISRKALVAELADVSYRSVITKAQLWL